MSTLAPWHLAFGNARAMGYYAQSIEESKHSTVRTLLSHPPAWLGQEVAPSEDELLAFEERIERVTYEFISSPQRKSQQKPTQRERQRRFMRGNKHTYVPLNARSQRLIPPQAVPLQQADPARSLPLDPAETPAATVPHLACAPSEAKTKPDPILPGQPLL